MIPLERVGVMTFASFLKNPHVYVHALRTFIERTPIGAKYLTPKLTTLLVEPTNACRLRCEMCVSQVVQKEGLPATKKGFMEMQLFRKIIDEACALRVPTIGLNYSGEPLLHPEFEEMLRYAGSKRRFKVFFNTAADGLTPEIQNAAVESCSCVAISMGGFRETHERIRKGSNYDRVSRYVGELIEKRNRRGQSEPRVEISLTKSGQSSDEIGKFVDFWSNIVDAVQVSECHDADYSLPSLEGEAMRLKKAGRRPCFDPWGTMAILWDGRITICCTDLRQNGLEGLDANDSSVRDIWGSPVYRAVRLSQASRKYSFPRFCQSCDGWIKHHICEETEQDGYRQLHFGVNKYFYKSSKELRK